MFDDSRGPKYNADVKSVTEQKKLRAKFSENNKLIDSLSKFAVNMS